jgi:beta-mannosidase
MDHKPPNLQGIWQLSRADGAYPCDYTIPGDVHSALLKAGYIPDPFFAKNELACRWVADDDWVARREFDWHGDGAWLLDADDLDTVVRIVLNGQVVLDAANSYRRYRTDVTEALRQGRNSIEIHFLSNTAAANERQAAQPYPVPYISWNSPIPNGNMLRKPACHFGWDWNLAIAPFGAHGRLELVPASLPVFELQSLYQSRLENGDMRVEVRYSILKNNERRLEVEHGLHLAGATATTSLQTKDCLTAVFVVHDPQLWWPVGWGKQTRHALIFSCEGYVDTRLIGLRTIEHIDEPDEVGRRFAFRVNGQEIFCRGANWIPANALPSNITPERCRSLLQSAVDANMNMIRVWGGGYYEKDWFYDICDELGLLVWQDFQFSCNLYPATESFLSEVEQEVRDQVMRLAHHPSIALWCGDNELVGALTWFPESRKNRDRYLVAYDRLNQTIARAAKTVDPKINWWPSSPSAGPLNFGDAWHDDTKGDMHFWSVWHEGKDFAHYRDVKPRFCSEFGFQSFPSLRICKQFVESEDDLNISSDVMNHHQRNAGGNARIAETMFRYFRFPNGFGNFVYISQIQHGLAMQTAVEYWRSIKPHCMGALMWQFNDTWPVASWSGLDYDGNWKAMHVMAQRFFAPVAVFAIPDKENQSVAFIGVNDNLQKADVALEVQTFTVGGISQIQQELSATLPTEHAVTLATLQRADMADDTILFWRVGDVRRHFTFKAYKDLKLPPPELKRDVKTLGIALEINIKAKNMALFVTLECDVAGRFSTNIFDLLPGETQTALFTPENPEHLQRAKDSLIIRDLYSSYH